MQTLAERSILARYWFPTVAKLHEASCSVRLLTQIAFLMGGRKPNDTITWFVHIWPSQGKFEGHPHCEKSYEVYRLLLDFKGPFPNIQGLFKEKSPEFKDFSRQMVKFKNSSCKKATKICMSAYLLADHHVAAALHLLMLTTLETEIVNCLHFTD